jgi:phospholipase C
MATGTHRVTVQAADAVGSILKQTIYLKVSTAAALAKIKHIIFLVQENRAVDDYFGMMNAYRQARGASAAFDGLTANTALYTSDGLKISAYPYQTVCTENLTSAWTPSQQDYDGGNMDGFLYSTAATGSTIDPVGARTMGYYDWNDLPYYYELAYQFGTSDRYFSSLLAATIPNRLYLFTGTSFGHIHADSPPAGGWTQPTIFDALRQNHISWRYYYQDNSVFLAQWNTWSLDKSNVVNISHWYTDVQNEATLPSVIFIERASQLGLDEHPENNVQAGAANTKKILDALMSSPSWASSVFILTYDEGGGLYDHVAPPSLPRPDGVSPMLLSGDPPGDFNRAGFRVPLIVVSPWSKPHMVSHVVRDHTSILKLIETRFGLPALTNRDAAADDMEEFFDFSTPHWLTPPPLPAQPTDGVCDKSLETAP